MYTRYLEEIDDMNILVVGGDGLDNIKNKLERCGANRVNHITGRKKGEKRIKISKNTDLILVMTDYIGHNMAEMIKRESKRNNISVMFSKRSWTYIEQNLKKCNYMKNN